MPHALGNGGLADNYLNDVQYMQAERLTHRYNLIVLYFQTFNTTSTWQTSSLLNTVCVTDAGNGMSRCQVKFSW